MATGTDFQPFEFVEVDVIGLTIKVNAVDARLPEKFLPKTVRVESTYVRRGGQHLLHHYLTHDGGQISLPVVPGDGTSDLRQLDGWLKRHGYRCTSGPLDGEDFYSRA